MNNISSSNPSNDRLQYAAFGAISLTTIGLTGIMSWSQRANTQPFRGSIPTKPVDFFRPFFGAVPPLVAISGVVAIGALSLGLLYSRGWFVILAAKGSARGIAASATVVALLGVEAAIVEITNLVRQPADMNVPLPWSLSFYPIMAYVVEVLFHVLPLALALTVLGPRFAKSNARHVVWLCTVVVALLEPSYQVDWNQAFSRASAYIGAQVFTINLLQLYAFRRYGFVAMYTLRLSYYLCWHIIWGQLRLRWLS